MQAIASTIDFSQLCLRMWNFCHDYAMQPVLPNQAIGHAAPNIVKSLTILLATVVYPHGNRTTLSCTILDFLVIHLAHLESIFRLA